MYHHRPYRISCSRFASPRAALVGDGMPPLPVADVDPIDDAPTALTLIGAMASDPPAHETLVILLGLLALVWIPTVRVPAPLNRVLGTIGGASLYLYLVHFQVNTVLGVDQPLVKMAIALVFGLIASVIGTRVLRVLVKT